MTATVPSYSDKGEGSLIIKKVYSINTNFLKWNYSHQKRSVKIILHQFLYTAINMTSQNWWSMPTAAMRQANHCLTTALQKHRCVFQEAFTLWTMTEPLLPLPDHEQIVTVAWQPVSKKNLVLYTALKSSANSTNGWHCSVAFIWMVTLWDFIQTQKLELKVWPLELSS